MINNDRVVSVIKTDLLSLIGVVMDIANVTVEKLSATNIGEFSVSTTNKTYLANEPLKALDFASAVSSGTVYFIPAHDYVGFTKNGSAVTTSGTVDADGVTLYKGVLSSGTVTFTKVGF